MVSTKISSDLNSNDYMPLSHHHFIPAFRSLCEWIGEHTLVGMIRKDDYERDFLSGGLMVW